MADTTAKRNVELGRQHYQKRVHQIQSYLAAHELDGALLLEPHNVIWASGFFHIPNERALGFYIPQDGEPTFFVPLLEREHVAELNAGKVQNYWEYPGEVPAEVWMLEQIPERRVAIDGVTHATFLKMQAVRPELRLDEGIAQLRYLKSDAELELVALAAGYADFALSVARRAIAEGLRAGITEIEVVRVVQLETTAKMQRELEALTNFYRGAVGLTVHTGPRAALPHGQPGPVVIKARDTVIAGVGARVGGFHAESGCTWVVGDRSPEQKRCLEATWACDQAAVDALRPGATCSSVNDAGLAAIRRAGFGEYIRHRIGHGIGIEGHEAPWLSAGDYTVLAPSMVFSNEPGIYRPGVDGYRIIDTMVVTPAGGKRLSAYLSQHGPDDRVIPA